jgi:hypothetical protein
MAIDTFHDVSLSASVLRRDNDGEGIDRKETLRIPATQGQRQSRDRKTLVVVFFHLDSPAG